MKGADAPIFENPSSRLPWPDVQDQRKLYFHPTLLRLGLRKRDAYQTRHTFATLALMAGVNPAYIARQLGHANTAMLFKHYSKWIDGADAGARSRSSMEFLDRIWTRKYRLCPESGYLLGCWGALRFWKIGRSALVTPTGLEPVFSP